MSFLQAKDEGKKQSASESPAGETEAGSVQEDPNSAVLIPPESTGPPAEIWGKFFSVQKVPPELVREIVQKLHHARKFDHVIAAIESALVNGQGQTWMYEVLALTMEVEGRPKEEVDRALLSGLDVGSKDYESTVYLAAYLVRFGRKERALKLYQEASKWSVERPEPYILGLRLAREMKDPGGIKWGACGILRYAWGKEHESQQREAEHAAADGMKLLKDRGETKGLDEFRNSVEAAKQRDLLIRIDWSGDADLDLIVQEPGGEACSSENGATAGGGRFLHDGYGPDQKNSYDAYLCSEGVSGEYKAIVRFVRGKVVANRATLTVITHQSTPNEKVVKKVFTIGLKDVEQTIVLEGGRREESKK